MSDDPEIRDDIQEASSISEFSGIDLYNEEISLTELVALMRLCREDPNLIKTEIEKNPIDSTNRLRLLGGLALNKPDNICNIIQQIKISENEFFHIAKSLAVRSPVHIFENFELFKLDQVKKNLVLEEVIKSRPIWMASNQPDSCRSLLSNNDTFLRLISGALNEKKATLALNLCKIHEELLTSKNSSSNLPDEILSKQLNSNKLTKNIDPKILETLTILIERKVKPSDLLLKYLPKHSSMLQRKLIRLIDDRPSLLQEKLLEACNIDEDITLNQKDLIKTLNHIMTNYPWRISMDTIRSVRNVLDKETNGLDLLEWEWKVQEAQLIYTNDRNTQIDVELESELQVYRPINLNSHEIETLREIDEVARPFLKIISNSDQNMLSCIYKKNSVIDERGLENYLNNLKEKLQNIYLTESELVDLILLGDNVTENSLQLISQKYGSNFSIFSNVKRFSHPTNLDSQVIETAKILVALDKLSYSLELSQIAKNLLNKGKKSQTIKDYYNLDTEKSITLLLASRLNSAKNEIKKNLKNYGIEVSPIISRVITNGPASLARASVNLSSSSDTWSLNNPDYAQLVYFDALKHKVVGVSQLHYLSKTDEVSGIVVRINPHTFFLKQFEVSNVGDLFLAPIKQLFQKSSYAILLPEQTESHLLSNSDELAKYYMQFYGDEFQADFRLSEELLVNKIFFLNKP